MRLTIALGLVGALVSASLAVLFVIRDGGGAPSEALLTSATPTCPVPTPNPHKLEGCVTYPPTSSPVPTIDPSTLAVARACGAEDLEGFYGRGGAATGGQLFAGVVMVNRSETPCKLEGTPVVDFLDSEGQPVGITAFRGQPCGVAAPCPFAARVILESQSGRFVAHQVLPGTARFQMSWYTHDGAGFCQEPRPLATALRIVLPGDAGKVDVIGGTSFDEIQIQPCGTHVSVGWFVPWNYTGTWPPRPVYYTNVRLLPDPNTPVPSDSPWTVEGERLVYRVIVTPFRSVSRLDSNPFSVSCPTYTVALSKGRLTEPGSQAITRETHQLRCDQSITRDDPEPLDIVLSLELASSVEPGKYSLAWFLDPTFDAQAGEEVEVEILASGP
jgi:Protein of unknown function (DUF4232)